MPFKSLIDIIGTHIVWENGCPELNSSRLNLPPNVFKNRRIDSVFTWCLNMNLNYCEVVDVWRYFMESRTAREPKSSIRVVTLIIRDCTGRCKINSLSGDSIIPIINSSLNWTMILTLIFKNSSFRNSTNICQRSASHNPYKLSAQLSSIAQTACIQSI